MSLAGGTSWTDVGFASREADSRRGTDAGDTIWRSTVAVTAINTNFNIFEASNKPDSVKNKFGSECEQELADDSVWMELLF